MTIAVSQNLEHFCERCFLFFISSIPTVLWTGISLVGSLGKIWHAYQALTQHYGPKRPEYRMGNCEAKTSRPNISELRWNFWSRYFFSHHAQHLNFAFKKDLGHSDRWKKTGTSKNSRPPPPPQRSLSATGFIYKSRGDTTIVLSLDLISGKNM